MRLKSIFDYTEPQLNKYLRDEDINLSINAKRYMVVRHLGIKDEHFTEHQYFPNAMLLSNSYFELEEYLYTEIGLFTLSLMDETLEKATLDDQGINVSNAKKISRALIGNNSLRIFNFTNINIDTDGFAYIADALIKNKSITTLNLSGDYLKATGAQYVSQIILRNRVIEHINLSQNDLKSLGTRHICELLKQNTTLKSINLNQNEIGNVGAQYVGEMLDINKTLKELHLQNNLITDARYIFDSNNQTIEKLWFGFNSISNMYHVGKFLERNKSLRILSFEWTNIKEKEFVYISDSLRINSTLTHLNISHNFITVNGMKYFSDALKENISLEYLNVSGNDGIVYIYDALEYNNHLVEIMPRLMTHPKLDKNLQYKLTMLPLLKGERIGLYLSMIIIHLSKDIIDEFIDFHKRINYNT